jgi:Fe-Mn family superoxide dismutase
MPRSRELKIGRRKFLQLVGLSAVAVSLGRIGLSAPEKGEGQKMAHELPPLPYGYDALEPYYDAQTEKLHHDIHHAGYVKGWNDAEVQVQAMLKSGDFAGAKAACKALAFHGSGATLHSIFWTNMKPGGGGAPSGDLAKAIEAAFGKYDAFKGFLLAATNAVEGSGWGILAYRKMDDALVVLQAEKHENLTQWGVTPILVLDVWEHAYYLKYQNKRPDWTKTFMDNLVNWGDVANRYAEAKGAMTVRG